MSVTDPYLSFSSITWFLVTFFCFFNFIVSNKNFLKILKNLKFRKKKLVKSSILVEKLSSFDLLIAFIYLFVQKWLQKWNKLVTGFCNALTVV